MNNISNLYFRRFVSYACTIIMIAICIFVSIDTKLFMYASLSRTLLMEMLILLMTLFVFLYDLYDGKKILSFLCNNKIYAFIAIWIVYILIHGNMSMETEFYRTYYLCVSLFSILIISFLLYTNIIMRSVIENGLLLILLINVLFVFGQYFGLLDTLNDFIIITGANENPNVTAIYIVGCLPLVLKRNVDKQNTFFSVSLLFASLLAIVLLRCRTAYIGIIVELSVFLLTRKHYITKILRSKFSFLILFLLVLSLSVFLVKLYTIKRDSSDSRLFIWKLSSEMIWNKPFGYGYGMFEKNYNLFQSDYFRNFHGTKRESEIAGFVNMPYNDFVEQGVEGGIIGMLFLLVFYFICIFRAKHNKDILCQCVFSAYLVMSLTNFLYSSVPPWWLLMCHVSLLDNDIGSSFTLKRRVPLLHILVIPIIICLTYKLMEITLSQMKLAAYFKYISHGNILPKSQLLVLKDKIGTSEVYWNVCALNNFKGGDYKSAVCNLKQAMRYTSMLKDFEVMYYSYKNNMMEDKGITYIDTLFYMQPSLLKPKLLLMQYYDRIGNYEKSLKYAYDIIATKARVDNSESFKIRQEAFLYINLKK